MVKCKISPFSSSGYLWRINLRCNEGDKCVSLKIQGTHSYPLSFTSVSTACLYDKPTSITSVEFISSTARATLFSTASSYKTVLPSTAASQTVLNYIISRSSSILPSSNAALSRPTQPTLSEAMKIQTAVVKYTNRPYVLQCAQFILPIFPIDN